MKAHWSVFVLTLINIILVGLNVFGSRGRLFQGTLPVLRGRTLEIVDDQARVRASIKLHPADPTYRWPDGRIGIPETVMLRLIDAKGRPEVKLGGSERGAGLGLIGQSDTTQIVLQAEGTESSVKVLNGDGKAQVIKP